MRSQLQRIKQRQRPRLREHAEPLRPAPSEPEQRVREAGGPDDQATYTCSCGFHFEAPVSTSVACPHCGSGQAW
jgi:hypothetical protein